MINESMPVAPADPQKLRHPRTEGHAKAADYDPERPGCPDCGDLDAIGGERCGECNAQWLAYQ